MARAKPTKQKSNNGANVGYETELWQMADALRGSMDAAEYKHVVLGLIFRRPTSTLREQQAEAAKLNTAMAVNLKEPGSGGEY